MGPKSIHFTGRMILFIKNPLKDPSINNLRPITVSSVLIKVLENIILRQCNAKFLVSLNKNRIGFTPGCSSDIHLELILSQLKLRRQKK